MATIHDVAAHAGVSATTVSRYLNNRIELPDGTARRIEAAVRSLDYRPNPVARRLSTGRSEAVSLVLPDIGEPVMASLAAAIQDEAEPHGYAVLISSTRGDASRQLAALGRLRDRQVDGILLVVARPDDGTLARLLDEAHPVVLLAEDVRGASAARVLIDNEQGAWAATRHLIAAGHSRIAHIGGPPELPSADEKHAGFVRALREAGLGIPATRISGPNDREFGRAAVRRLLERREPPTAILAASDRIAIGVLMELRARGLSVPADMSVVGFDDGPFAEMLVPPLTTMRSPFRELGRAGFAALLAAIKGEPMDPVQRLRVQLVERQSVAPLRRTDKLPG